MQNVLNAVRNLDLFAVPVSLTYKGKTRFSTLCGGSISLVIILAFATYAGLYMHKLITDPVLKSNSEKLIVSSAANNETFVLDTKNTTVALSIKRLKHSIKETN